MVLLQNQVETRKYATSPNEEIRKEAPEWLAKAKLNQPANWESQPGPRGRRTGLTGRAELAGELGHPTGPSWLANGAIQRGRAGQ